MLSPNLVQEDQTNLFHLLHFWELTMPGAPGDDGSTVTLHESFKYLYAFRQAIADDIDRAVIVDGWMSCTVNEGSGELEAFIRSALRESISFLRRSKKVRLWSGGDGVAEATDKREGPPGGDAFRLCEAEVVASLGRFAFVFAIYVYSDSSVLSWSGNKSGGTFNAIFEGEWLERSGVDSGAIEGAVHGTSTISTGKSLTRALCSTRTRPVLL